jgi:uncharacterized membrane protein YgdD (TMEM256/DUF423 family)
MLKKWTAAAAISGALAVMLGALSAHALKGKITPDLLASFKTGAEYQMYHSLAMLVVAMAGSVLNTRLQRICLMLFAAGIVFFSGSLYLLSTHELIGLTNWEWLGPITPLGGLCFIAGWLCLAWTAIKK